MVGHPAPDKPQPRLPTTASDAKHRRDPPAEGNAPEKVHPAASSRSPRSADPVDAFHGSHATSDSPWCRHGESPSAQDALGPVRAAEPDETSPSPVWPRAASSVASGSSRASESRTGLPSPARYRRASDGRHARSLRERIDREQRPGRSSFRHAVPPGARAPTLDSARRSGSRWWGGPDDESDGRDNRPDPGPAEGRRSCRCTPANDGP